MAALKILTEKKIQKRKKNNKKTRGKKLQKTGSSNYQYEQRTRTVLLNFKNRNS